MQKVAGASPDRWGHGAPMRQRGPPWSRGQCLCFCVTLLSQDQPPEHKWTFTFLNDEPDLPEHEVQEPEDTHKKGKPCLILFKTRSVQDTFHDACFCLTRHDLFKTQSVQDTFHDACFCHTPHVDFSGDRVRGARFCHHLHSGFFSDRIRGSYLLSPTQRLLQ